MSFRPQTKEDMRAEKIVGILEKLAVVVLNNADQIRTILKIMEREK